MSYVNLDLDELCSEANPSTVHFVMREWEKGESPSTYWYKKFYELDKRENLQKITLDHFPNDRTVPLVLGLPKNEALFMCKELYKNSIAKVTIQISGDTVLMTTRDFSITFAEQLSVISMLL